MCKTVARIPCFAHILIKLQKKLNISSKLKDNLLWFFDYESSRYIEQKHVKKITIKFYLMEEFFITKKHKNDQNMERKSKF